MSEFKIAWLFPDTMYLHGERGNILALARYAEFAGYTPSVVKVDFDTEDFDPAAYDILFVAPGEVVSFPSVIQWLRPYRDKLEAYVASGRPMLVTGTSIGLFGRKITREDGTVFEGLGMIGLETKERDSVYGDDDYFRVNYNGEEMEIIGSTIQMCDFRMEDEKPFGELIYGYGNNGKDRQEGVQVRNAVFTNALGPVLVCNPWLTKEMIRVAAAVRGDGDVPIDADMSLEKKSFEMKKDFNLHKKTNLTNCAG